MGTKGAYINLKGQDSQLVILYIIFFKSSIFPKLIAITQTSMIISYLLC
jgi:hypothetical protein